MRRLMVGLVAFLVLSLPAIARAATRYVTATGSDNAACSQASPCRTVAHAVAIATAGDTIQIAKGQYLEPLGVVIDKNLVLNGVGSFSTIVKGGIQSRVFHIQEDVTAEINAMQIRNGSSPQGAGIYNEGSLSMHDVRVWKNTATADGGGIFNTLDGELFMNDSEIAYNDAAGNGAGLRNDGNALLTQTRIVANHAVVGGGIMNTESATLYLLQSLVARNSDHGVFNIGDATVTNTTVAYNRGAGVYTGAIGRSVLTHLTIADNGGQGSLPSGVLIGGEVTIRNTLLVGNATFNCVFATGGILVSATGNLDSGNSCTFFPWANLINVDPKIGPLKNNGGFSQTYAPKTGSLAIDRADQAWCEQVDQRGVLRVIDGDQDGVVACDIGAYEYSPFRRIDQTGAR